MLAIQCMMTSKVVLSMTFPSANCFRMLFAKSDSEAWLGPMVEEKVVEMFGKRTKSEIVVFARLTFFGEFLEQCIITLRLIRSKLNDSMICIYGFH